MIQKSQPVTCSYLHHGGGFLCSRRSPRLVLVGRPRYDASLQPLRLWSEALGDSGPQPTVSWSR